MYTKLLGLGIMLFGVYIIYAKRHLEDDSLLLGSMLVLTGLLITIIGWIVKLDSRK